MSSLIPTQQEMDVLTCAARTAVRSSLLKGKNEEQAIAIALYARELGLPIMQSLMGGINIINGVAEISVRMMNNLIRKKGHQIKCIESTREICTLEGIRADTGEACTVTFTFREAQQAGLVKNGGAWEKWTADMIYARAFSRLARRLFPDAIGPAYVEGEISQEEPKTFSRFEEEAEVEHVSDKLTKEQTSHIKELLKDNKELMEMILSKAGKTMVSDFEQSRYDGIVRYIEQELKKGAA